MTRPLSRLLSPKQHEKVFRGLDQLCMMSELLLDNVAFQYEQLPNNGDNYVSNKLELNVYAENVSL